MAFAWMCLRASWQPVRVRYKGIAIQLDRGQLAVSVRDLAEALDRPKGWVERLLNRLKSETMIETRAETGVTVITVCNYDEYQPQQDSDRTPRGTRGGTPAGQRQDTEQRREKGKEGKKKRRKILLRSRRSAIDQRPKRSCFPMISLQRTPCRRSTRWARHSTDIRPAAPAWCPAPAPCHYPPTGGAVSLAALPRSAARRRGTRCWRASVDRRSFAATPPETGSSPKSTGC